MPRTRPTIDQVRTWLEAHDSIAHRDDILRAGYSIEVIRALVRVGGATLIRRKWIALPSATQDLATAARAGGRVTCVSLARRRGWWMPESVGMEMHLHLVQGSGSARLDEDWPGVLHWTKPISIAPRGELTATIADALGHIAVCQPFVAALTLWESAARREHIAAETLRGIPFIPRAARELAERVTGLSDSGLETLVVEPLRRWGLRVRQQVKLAGRFVDVLVGERLVLQIDGYGHHSSSAQRSKDIAHDAELRLRGYTVLRFSYAQVVHGWDEVARTIGQAIASGLHLA